MASVTPSNVSMRQHNQYEIEQSKQGRFPHKRPLPYRKKGTEQEIHSAPITHSKTDETVVSSVFSFCPESRLTHTLTQTRKGPERFRKQPRGHSPSHRLPAAGLWWSHGRRCPE